MRYQTTERDGQITVTGPMNRGPYGDGYYLGVFRTAYHASLFIRAMEMADLAAPIGDDLPCPECGSFEDGCECGYGIEHI